MSVPVPKRGHGELEVNTKARNLTVYTLHILANEKHFPQEQAAYIDMIRETAINISALCWEANNIKVNNDMNRYMRRLSLQDQAADQCNRLCYLIEIAKQLFHLETRRVRYWLEQTTELRSYIHAWRDSNAQNLKPTE